MAKKFVKVTGLNKVFDVSTDGASLDITKVKESVIESADDYSILFIKADADDEEYGYKENSTYAWARGILVGVNSNNASRAIDVNDIEILSAESIEALNLKDGDFINVSGDTEGNVSFNASICTIKDAEDGADGLVSAQDAYNELIGIELVTSVSFEAIKDNVGLTENLTVEWNGAFDDDTTIVDAIKELKVQPADEDTNRAVNINDTEILSNDDTATPLNFTDSDYINVSGDTDGNVSFNVSTCELKNASETNDGLATAYDVYTELINIEKTCADGFGAIKDSTGLNEDFSIDWAGDFDDDTTIVNAIKDLKENQTVDTNRSIKVNGTEIIKTNDTTPLDLSAGENITITFDQSHKVCISAEGSGSEGHIYNATNDSLAEGTNVAKGALNVASGIRSHAQGVGTSATATGSFAMGYNTPEAINSTITAGGAGAFVGGCIIAADESLTNAHILAIGYGSFATGEVEYNNSSITAESDATIAIGRVSAENSAITATNDAGFAHGYITANNAKISANGAASIASGTINNLNCIIGAYGSGASAHGCINADNSSIIANTDGTMVFGYIGGDNARILTESDGSFAFGSCSGSDDIPSSILSTGSGSFAFGEVVNGDIISNGNGALAGGLVGGGSIQAQGSGSIAFGSAGVYDIICDGEGSIAIGGCVNNSGSVEVLGRSSVAIGNNISIDGDNIVAIGSGLHTSESGTYVFGTYNEEDIEAIFTLAHGTSNTARRNIFTIDRDGQTFATHYYEVSDERLKDFSEDINVDFNKLKDIPKKYFTWKADDNKKVEIGTSAQKLMEIYPELVSYSASVDRYTVDYAKLSMVALAAVDKLHDENEELKNRLAKLEEAVEKLMK